MTEKSEDGKDLVFSWCVFSWKDGKVKEWKYFLFGCREKWKDRKCNLYKFTIMSLLLST